MAGQFQIRSFFRDISTVLLKEYLEANDVRLQVLDAGTGELQPLDLGALEEHDVEPIWKAWSGVDDETRSRIESDFADVAEIGTESGVQIILDQSRWEGLDLGDELASLADPVDCAMWVFVNYRQLFEEAFRLQTADQRSTRQWQKRKNLPQRNADDDADARGRLGAALSLYFRAREARGHHFHVESVRRGDRQYIFAYGEDHARAEQDFVQGQMRRRSHNPAFEVVFAFDPKQGTLDTFARGGKVVVSDLQEIFAREMLHTAIGRREEDNRVYDFQPLESRDFNFAYDPAWGIAQASVVGLRASLLATKGTRLILEATTQEALYDRLERTVQPWAKGERWAVTQVTVSVSYLQGGARRKPNGKKFVVTYPSSRSLKQGERDLHLREMLVRSGIDPSGIGLDARRR